MRRSGARARADRPRTLATRGLVPGRAAARTRQYTCNPAASPRRRGHTVEHGLDGIGHSRTVEMSPARTTDAGPRGGGEPALRPAGRSRGARHPERRDGAGVRQARGPAAPAAGPRAARGDAGRQLPAPGSGLSRPRGRRAAPARRRAALARAGGGALRGRRPGWRSRRSPPCGCRSPPTARSRATTRPWRTSSPASRSPTTCRSSGARRCSTSSSTTQSRPRRRTSPSGRESSASGCAS